MGPISKFQSVEIQPLLMNVRNTRSVSITNIFTLLLCFMTLGCMVVIIPTINTIYERTSTDNYGWNSDTHQIIRTNSQIKSLSKENISTKTYNSASSSPRIFIVHTEDDLVAELANAVAEGALKVNQNMNDLRVRTEKNATFDDVLWADAIILGTSVINANVQPELQAWINSWDFHSDLHKKVGAAFVTAGGISAGEELTLMSLIHSMLIFRLIIVGGDKWTYAFGASAITNEDPFRTIPTSNEMYFPRICYQDTNSKKKLHSMFLKKGFALGRRVTLVAKSLKQSP